MTSDVRLSPADAALVSTIYDPPHARRRWTLKDVLPDGATAYYSLARWALVDALRACGVGPGDRVVVPGLICREVLASINLLGASAVFYAVSRQLCAHFSAHEIGPAKAVLAVNYFGFPQDLQVFRRYCDQTGAALIEDNAHGFLSRDESGQWLGSRGDAGLFSFRKTIAVPNGSALIVNGRELRQTTDLRPHAPGAHYRLKQMFRRVAAVIGPARTHTAIAAVRQLRRALTGAAVPPVSPDAETRIPLAPNPSSAISGAVAVAEPELEAERRRSLYELAARIIDRSGAVPLFPCLPRNVVPYGFPLFAPQGQARGIAADVGRYGFQLSQWPDLPAAVIPSAPEHYRQLMVLPFLW
jgi:hypothetical protein